MESKLLCLSVYTPRSQHLGSSYTGINFLLSTWMVEARVECMVGDSTGVYELARYSVVRGHHI